jgi:hypothetical protein
MTADGLKELDRIYRINWMEEADPGTLSVCSH